MAPRLRVGRGALERTELLESTLQRFPYQRLLLRLEASPQELHLGFSPEPHGLAVLSYQFEPA